MAKRKKSRKNQIYAIILLILSIIIYFYQDEIKTFLVNNFISHASYTLEEVPDYNGKQIIYLNNNVPNFTEEDYNMKAKEFYSELDILNRAGYAIAKVGLDTMPTEERGDINMIKPSGWHTIKYDFIDGKYLYNRCHLIGYQLTGENANEKNLITCTRTTNAINMLKYENKVAKYVKETNNHVLYRVTPIYEDTDLVAKGIELEASSIEDKGKGLEFHVYIYNVEDGIEINYASGDSKLKE